MGRKKAFDRTAVLTKARDVFWEKGYEATSMKDLSQAMGINPFSIYDTFTNKEQLFVEALTEYQQTNYFGARQALEGIGTPIERITTLFTGLRDQILNDRACRGCLLVNTITELSAVIPAVDAIIEHNEGAFLLLFEEVVREGQAVGEFKVSQSARQLAAFLFASFQGMRVFGITNQSRPLVEGITQQVIDALKP